MTCSALIVFEKILWCPLLLFLRINYYQITLSLKILVKFYSCSHSWHGIHHHQAYLSTKLAPHNWLTKDWLPINYVSNKIRACFIGCMATDKLEDWLAPSLLMWHDAQKPYTGIILCMCPANERWRYIVMSSLIGWAHIQMKPAHSHLQLSCYLLHLQWGCQYHCTRKTSMIHQTFVRWALYILFKYVKSLVRHLWAQPLEMFDVSDDFR